MPEKSVFDPLVEALCAQMPWRVGGTREGVGPQGANDRFIRDRTGRIVACASEGSIDEARAIARRIVACVNACVGIDTAQLERFSLVDFRESALNVVRNWERGDLASAVNILEGDAEAIGGSAADGDETEDDENDDANADVEAAEETGA